MVYGKLKGFPVEERFALCDQIRRAVVSVPSNIAEGYGRDTHKDFAHFLSQAKGSLYELDTQLDLAIDLGYMKRDTALDSRIDEISRMLSAFRTRLLMSATPSPHSARVSAECGVLSAESENRTKHQAQGTKHHHYALADAANLAIGLRPVRGDDLDCADALRPQRLEDLLAAVGLDLRLVAYSVR